MITFRKNPAVVITLAKDDCLRIEAALAVAIGDIQASLDRAGETEEDAVKNAEFITTWLNHRDTLHELLSAIVSS